MRNSGGEYYDNQSNPTKMATDIGPRKTMFVLVIVVGCFAVLWPKVFYPMLVGSANQLIKPSAIDKTAGCCDVFSEGDINTIKIMSELCKNIIQQSEERPLSDKEIVTECKAEVLSTCGIDISAVLQEQIRLGRSVKQILSEVRSLNGSLCLKYNFGVAPWRLGVPHRIAVNFTSSKGVRQERPLHLKEEVIHPAFRERGSAIPKPPDSTSRGLLRTEEGRPGPVAGMRPPLGGAGHVVPSSQKTASSMSVIMPIYTVGIVIFFTYTLMKLLFKKQPDGVGGSLYPPIEPDLRFRKEVFEADRCKITPRLSRDPYGKIVVNAMSALLDEVDGEYEARRKANDVTNQVRTANNNQANGDISSGSGTRTQDSEQTSVRVLGMEMTASCEGGKKWNRPNDLVVPNAVGPQETVHQEPPQEIYLAGSLPAQSQLLVADSATEAQQVTSSASTDPAIVLAGKMTLSVISLDSVQDNGTNEKDEIEEIIEINGDNDVLDEELIEESKYTTASNATFTENDISDEQNASNGEVEVEEIEEIEVEDEEAEEVEMENEKTENVSAVNFKGNHASDTSNE